MSLVVIAYDISSNRRRARVHALLLGYGEAVQESLSECDLDDAALRRLKTALERQLRPADNVRVYSICAACAAAIDDGRGTRRPDAPEVYIT